MHGFYFLLHLTQEEGIIPRKQTAAHLKLKAGNALFQQEELAGKPGSAVLQGHSIMTVKERIGYL